MNNLRINSFQDYQNQYQRSIEDPEQFWASIAGSFQWKKPFSKVLNWNFDEPNVRWFEDGTLNITENMLDRYVETQPEKIAILWEPNDPKQETKKFTYAQTLKEVNRIANALRNVGVQKGDRVCLYMPMIPELAFSVMACARIGAIHSVVFAGFSASSLSDRINDAGAKVVLTSDGLNRGEKMVPLKPIVDEALLLCSTIETVFVFNCTGNEVNMIAGRDLWWEEALKGMPDVCAAEEMNSEDPLFILYTSGSTGKPKGIVHTCGGYMVYTAYSFQNVYQYNEKDVFWCTADIGWITGHSYIVYGPLLSGATTVMFEGIPTYPDASRFWKIIEKHKVNQFLTAPTAIRSLMPFGTDPVNSANLDSLKVIGSVGEPINEEAWVWYYENVGKSKCAVVDNWWQTETGGIMISGLGNLSPLKPTYAGFPLPGIQPVLLRQNGEEIAAANEEGYLCVKFPWPSMLRSTWGDHERCRQTYFSQYAGYYFTGDGAKRDEDGMFRIIGRIDDVINVSGHRFGTAEIENAINESDWVVESAVVGYPHDIKGQSIYAFVVCDRVPENESEVRKDIAETVAKEIGKIALPEKIQFVSGLPKTRSGKIMRRILRKVAEGEVNSLGDTSTLLDPGVVDEIVKGKL